MQDLLTDGDYDVLCGILAREYGVNLRLTDAGIIRAKLRTYCERHGLASPAECIRRLQDEGARTQELGEIVYSQSTFFNREPGHFQFLLDTLRRQRQEAPEDFAARDLAIWCAGCSTGQEPYTVAIYLLDRIFTDPAIPPAFHVLGSDCARASLAQAEAGEYAMADARRFEPMDFSPYFEPIGEERLRIAPAVRARVAFREFNLVTSPYTFDRPFDWVFLRNALDFHDLPSKLTVLGDVRRAMAPGGHLVMGFVPMISVPDIERCGYERIVEGCYRVVG
jgi:chemotaxis protein methyltransferase CheR